MAVPVALAGEYLPILDEVRAVAPRLKDALRPFGVSRVAVFGSVARREDGPDSDVDLIIDIERTVGLFSLLRMQGIAQEILGRNVDLVVRSSLKLHIAPQALREAIEL